MKLELLIDPTDVGSIVVYPALSGHLAVMPAYAVTAIQISRLRCHVNLPATQTATRAGER
ncbi:hypothetical protein [Stenotrophomonas sp. 9(2022)]|uniref:hypothetical protein n=1 Tax=Stenotrophomonas sp. 9(2022) TaxID=2950153 RepID=UPI0021140820|nr:hypothetical protein [Stenotrophomonas sp. 9(2022)]